MMLLKILDVKLNLFLFLFTLSIPFGFGAKSIKNIHDYQNITIQVLDKNNRALENAKVYAYSKHYHLLWPRTDRLEERHEELQYKYSWKNHFSETTDRKGTVQAIIPKGEWSFFACGQNRSGDIILAWSSYIFIEEGKTVILKPENSSRVNFEFDESGKQSSIQQKRIFFRPKHLPIFLDHEFSRRTLSTIRLQVSTHEEIDVWAEGISSRDKTSSCIINWGTQKFDEDKVLTIDSSKLAKVELRERMNHVELRWDCLSMPGVLSQSVIKSPGCIWMSPGNYRLGYSYPISGKLVEFTSKFYSFKEKGQQIIEFNDKDFKTNIGSQVLKNDILSLLMIVDKNNHMIKSIKDKRGKGIEIKAVGDCYGESVSVKQQNPGELYFISEKKGDFYDMKWRFGISIGNIKAKLYQTESNKLVVSRHFWAKVPPAITEYVKSIFEEADIAEDLVRKISHRSKKFKTYINIKIEQKGAVADHHGGSLSIGSVLLTSDRPISHGFLHELGHNFGLYHGGMMEMLVEATREQPMMIYGQSSKWLFMDRMNHKFKLEKWYPHTGIYLYAYSQGGDDFLKFISHNELEIRDQLSKSGYPKELVTAALLGVGLNKDMSETSIKYGLIKNDNQYKNAVLEIKSKITLPPYEKNTIDSLEAESLSDWVMLGGEWSNHHPWIKGEFKHEKGDPRALYHIDNIYEHKLKVEIKNTPDSSLGYLGVAVWLDKTKYSCELGVNFNRQKAISSPEQKDVQDFSLSNDKTYEVLIEITKNHVIFSIDGKKQKSLTRNENANEGQLMLSSARSRSIMFSINKL